MSEFDFERWIREARKLHSQVIRSGEAAGLVYRGGGAFILPAVDLVGGIRTKEVDWWFDRAKTQEELTPAIAKAWELWEWRIRKEVAKHKHPQDGVKAFFQKEFDGETPTTIEGLQGLTHDVIGNLGQMPSWRYTIAENRARLRRGLNVMTGSTFGAIAAGAAAHIRGGWHPTADDWEAAYPVGELVATGSNLLVPRGVKGRQVTPRMTVRPTSGKPPTHQRTVANREVGSASRAIDNRVNSKPASSGLSSSSASASRKQPPPSKPATGPSVPKPKRRADKGRNKSRRGPTPKPLSVKGFRTEPRQQVVLGRMLGRRLSQTSPREVRRSLNKEHRDELRAVERDSADLIMRIRDHWDAAGPTGSTATTLAKNTLRFLKRAKPKNPNSKARERIFDPWRKRAMTRIANDQALVKDLKEKAGITVANNPKTGTKSLRLRAKAADGRNIHVWLDIDHAGTGHSKAVREALTSNDPNLLLSTIESGNLQILTARENRQVIETLRRDSQKWPSRSE